MFTLFMVFVLVHLSSFKTRADSPVSADMFGREQMGRIKVGTYGRLLTLREILSSLNSFSVTYMNDLFTISFTLSTNYQWIGDENELIA